LQVYASGGSSWIIDSGCTNHMTGEKRMFSSYEKNEDPQRAITHYYIYDYLRHTIKDSYKYIL
jgi:hypothetical protein